MRRFGLIAFVCLLAACGDAPTETRATPKVVSEIGDTEWRLATLEGAEVPVSNVVMKIAGGFISGTAPCNTVNANYLGELPDFRVELLVTTKSSCDEIALEQAILRTMIEARKAVVVDSRLTLTTEDGRTMVFVPT